MTRRALLLAFLLPLGGCRQDMHDQPKLKPYASSSFFADQRGSRQLVAGTVARGQLREDALLFSGLQDGKPAAELPFPLTLDVLERGQQRYLIYCTPCHGQAGRGDGIVVRRGYRKPTTFHDARLRGEPVGYFYDVITRGFGAMPDYATQVGVHDRWAIAAYVKALQLSQYADAKQLGIEIAQKPAAAGPQK